MAVDNMQYLATIQALHSSAQAAIDSLETRISDSSYSGEDRQMFALVQTIVKMQDGLIRRQVEHQMVVEDKLQSLIDKHLNE